MSVRPSRLSRIAALRWTSQEDKYSPTGRPARFRHMTAPGAGVGRRSKIFTAGGAGVLAGLAAAAVPGAQPFLACVGSIATAVVGAAALTEPKRGRKMGYWCITGLLLIVTALWIFAWPSEQAEPNDGVEPDSTDTATTTPPATPSPSSSSTGPDNSSVASQSLLTASVPVPPVTPVEMKIAELTTAEFYDRSLLVGVETVTPSGVDVQLSTPTAECSALLAVGQSTILAARAESRWFKVTVLAIHVDSASATIRTQFGQGNDAPSSFVTCRPPF